MFKKTAKIAKAAKAGGASGPAAGSGSGDDSAASSKGSVKRKFRSLLKRDRVVVPPSPALITTTDSSDKVTVSMVAVVDATPLPLLDGQVETTAKAEPAVHDDIVRQDAAEVSSWDRAYDALKDEKPELVTKYEELLSQVSSGKYPALSCSVSDLSYQPYSRLL